MEPIRIRNPGTQNTVVRLHPNQSLILEFTDPESILDVDFDSVFFELEKEDTIPFFNAITHKQSPIKQYHFSQKFDLTDWSEISSMYMGEIFIMRQEKVTSLCILLDSSSISNILTVVNPSSCCLKLRPQQLLEVVVFDPNKGEPTQWDVNVSVGVYQLQYQQIKHAIVNPKNFNPRDFIYDPLIPYPRVSDAEMEHHFWFKSCYMQQGFNPAWPPGLYDGGKIVFSGKSKSGKILNNTVKMNLRVKKKGYHSPVIFKPKHHTRAVYPLCEEVDIKEKHIADPWEGCRILDGEVRPKKHRSVIICDESYD